MRFAALLLVLALPLAAEPNFAGSWMLNTLKSEYGRFPKPDVMMRTVQQQGSQLVFSTYQKGAQGEVTTEVKYTTDGRPAKNGENQGTARWDGDNLVIESSREYQGNKLTQREVWSLSADGKTLTVISHVALPNGQFDVTQVFEKAPAPTTPTRANF